MRVTRRAKILCALVLMVAVFAYAASYLLVDYSALNAAYSGVRTPGFSLIVNAYETLEGIQIYRDIARSQVQGKTNDIERIIALNTWAHNHVRSIYAYPEGIISDNFYNILRRGHGYCDQIAHVFATLAHCAGYQTRLFMLKDPRSHQSHHTIAQFWHDNQWRIAEPYLGIVPLTPQQQFISIEDLQKEPDLLIKHYQQAGVPVSKEDFLQGTPFHTFPYMGLGGLLKKVFRRLWPDSSPANSPPNGLPAGFHPRGMALDKNVRRLIIQFDRARRAHLEGQFTHARAQYAALLSQKIPDQARDDALFFYAFAFYEEKHFREAISHWEQLIQYRPNSLWVASSHYFIGEASVNLADYEKARRHWQSGPTPLARLRYLSLTSSPGTLNQ